MRPLLALLGLVVAAAAPPCSAADDPERPAAEVEAILGRERIELIDLFRLADLTSPILAAARSNVAARAGRLHQAGLAANPRIGLEVEEASLEDFDDRKEKVQIVQPIPVGSRRGPAETLRSRELEVARQRLEDARRDVRGRVHNRLVELLHAQALSEATAELIEEASRTQEIARKRFEARAVPESQVTRALLERYELELQHDRAESDRLRAAEELRALFGGVDVPRGRLVAPAPLGAIPATEELTGRLGSHPGLVASRLGAEAAAARHRQTRAARLPDLEVRAAYGRHVGRDEGFVEAGIDVALPLFDRNQGRIEEARAMLRQAEHDTRRLEGELAAQLEVARQRRSLVARQLATHRETIEPSAARGLEQARAGYRAGRLPFLELLDAQQTLARVRTRTLGLERDHALATAELSRLAGLGPYQE